MNTPLTPPFEQHLLRNEITGNYNQMIQARARNEGVLEKTFEQRMNNGLQAYFDLMKVTGRLALGVGDEIAA